MPDSSGLGKLGPSSGARIGLVDSTKAIETFSGFTLGLAAWAINSFSSVIVILIGIEDSSSDTAIDISSITPAFVYSFT